MFFDILNIRLILVRIKTYPKEIVMFDHYAFYIYQKENKMWSWRIENAQKKVIGRSELEWINYQDVVQEIVKIVKINKWEKDEPDLHRVLIDKNKQ